MVTERRVSLKGAVNFRDLGGYRSEDGRLIKWGQVFRSDNLSRLTDEDLTRVKSLNLRLVCDLRTENETKKSPDRLPDNEVGYLNLPVNHDSFDFQIGLKKMREGDDSWLTNEFMIEGYIRNVEEAPEVWGVVLKRLADPDSRPLLFHCTGGKDRAGTCAALILLALGVPEETVIEDHQLSNIYIADIMDQINARISAYGLDPKKLKPYFSAPKEAIMALLDHLKKQYGSAHDYLSLRAGIDQGVISALKQELLE
jgi:protein-tyrosine phosphatase